MGVYVPHSVETTDPAKKAGSDQADKLLGNGDSSNLPGLGKASLADVQQLNAPPSSGTSSDHSAALPTLAIDSHEGKSGRQAALTQGQNLFADPTLTADMTKVVIGPDGKAVNEVNAALAGNLIKTEAIAASATQLDVLRKKMTEQVAEASPKQDAAQVAAKTAQDASDNKQIIAKIVGDHTPGQVWTSAAGTVFSLDSKGDLTIAGKNAVARYGVDGSLYTNENGVQTWRDGGMQIQKSVDGNFSYKDASGDPVTLNAKEQSVVTLINKLQISEFTHKFQGSSIDAIRKMSDGISSYSDATAYVGSDANGNKMVKNSLHSGELIFGANGASYLVEKGNVYLLDKNTNAHIKREDKLPYGMTRLSDGSISFANGAVRISRNDEVTDSRINADIKDTNSVITAAPPDANGRKDQFITLTAKPSGTDHTLEVKNAAGGIILANDMVAGDKTHPSTFTMTNGQGQPELAYNFNTDVMNANGITFTSEGAQIQGSNEILSASVSMELSRMQLKQLHYNSESQVSQSNVDNAAAQTADNDNASGQNGDGADSNASQLTATDGINGLIDGQDYAYGAGGIWQKWTRLHNEGLTSDKPDQISLDLTVKGIASEVHSKVNISNIQLGLNDLNAGIATISDAAAFETSREQISAVSAQLEQLGFNVPGILSWMAGVQNRINDEVTASRQLQDYGLSVNAENIKQVQDAGGILPKFSRRDEVDRLTA